MNTIHIKEPQTLLNQLNNIEQHVQNFSRVQENLYEICEEIKKAWESDTIDKESYLKKITDAKAKLNTLILSLQTLSSHLQNYTYEQIYNSQN